MRPMTRKSTALLVAAAAIATFATVQMIPVKEAEAYLCKGSYETAQGSAIAQSTARTRAKNNWSSYVNNKFGLSWSVWDIAQSSSIDCSKPGARWVCTARAKPCNYVVQ